MLSLPYSKQYYMSGLREKKKNGICEFSDLDINFL